MAHSFGTLLCAEAWDESADPIDDDLGLPISGGASTLEVAEGSKVSKEPEVLTLHLPGPDLILVFLKFLSKSSSLPSYLASKLSVLSFITGVENRKARN